MGIWKEMFARWLGWTCGGAFFGVLAGVVVGGLHGAVGATAFLPGGVPGSLPLSKAAVGCGFGAYYAVFEGAVSGTIGFCLAALLRMKSPTLLSIPHFKTTMRSAFLLCALGAVGGSMMAMAAVFLLTRSASYGAKDAIGIGFFYGCQVGFNVGMLCGALLPIWVKGFPPSRKHRATAPDFVAQSD